MLLRRRLSLTDRFVYSLSQHMSSCPLRARRSLVVCYHADTSQSLQLAVTFRRLPQVYCRRRRIFKVLLLSCAHRRRRQPAEIVVAIVQCTRLLSIKHGRRLCTNN